MRRAHPGFGAALSSVKAAKLFTAMRAMFVLPSSIVQLPFPFQVQSDHAVPAAAVEVAIGRRPHRLLAAEAAFGRARHARKVLRWVHFIG